MDIGRAQLLVTDAEKSLNAAELSRNGERITTAKSALADRTRELATLRDNLAAAKTDAAELNKLRSSQGRFLNAAREFLKAHGF